MKKLNFKRALALLLTLTLVLACGATAALAAGCPVSVNYSLSTKGTSADLTAEKVAVDAKPKSVPTVVARPGFKFLGWSLTDPATLKDGQTAELVDPTTMRVTGDTTFFAVYESTAGAHKHFVIGYPNGNFGPLDNINRASVATIIARAVLPDFVEGSDYGNPGGYSDVSGHWAESAIAYCSKFGVFNGYTDGTFRPNQPITRQEFALAIARIDGLETMTQVPFPDIDKAGSWALDGIYTAYTRGLVVGDGNGNFRPLDLIQRAEAVTIFNRYLRRGVNAAGLADVYRGSNNNGMEDGQNRYMIWPDVKEDYWAYHEIIEAANDHEFYYLDPDASTTDEARLEHWTRS